jgi:hypothetical protein
MNPQLLEILKKAKAVDKAAQKFDNGAPKRSQSAGLMNEIDGTKLISAEEAGMSHSGGNMMNNSTQSFTVKKDVQSEGYKKAVTGSKLPPAIQKAMLENPIPQPDMGFDVDEESIRELRGDVREDNGPYYNEEDEVDMYEKPVRRQEVQKKRVIREEVSEPINIDEKYLRKLIASELTKALPKIIEHYFDNRLVKENVQFKAGNTIFSGTVMPMPKVKGKNNI